MDLPDFLYTDADGEVRVTGHRIRLIDVATRYNEGHSPEGILLDHYPTLRLPLIYKTVAFFLENEAEVQEMIRRNAGEMSRLAAQPRTSPTFADLRRRMASRRQAEAS